MMVSAVDGPTCGSSSSSSTSAVLMFTRSGCWTSTLLDLVQRDAVHDARRGLGDPGGVQCAACEHSNNERTDDDLGKMIPEEVREGFLGINVPAAGRRIEVCVRRAVDPTYSSSEVCEVSLPTLPFTYLAIPPRRFSRWECCC
jgi:hypothetical protein